MDEVPLREDTMLYREPAQDTPEDAVHDIWGKKLETKVVDASEVPAMLKEGWVTNPLHIDNPPKPEEAAGFVPDTKELDVLRKAADDLLIQLEQAKEREAVLAAEVAGLKDDLKAAEALIAEQGKKTLSVKKEG